MNCCENAVSMVGDERSASIYVPSFHMGHHPIGSVPIADVEDLVRTGLLTECDGHQIYALQGKALGLVCSDPAMQEHKIRILNRSGPLSIWSLPGYGLRFDPQGMLPNEVPARIMEIQKFLQDVGIPHFGLRAVVFGAHAPCGASGGMTLKEVCRSVAIGARHLKQALLSADMTKHFTVFPTIFINTEMTSPSGETSIQLLSWKYINKGIL